MTAFGVNSALRRLATADLWPGFEPLRSPLAIFDGTVTTLFRHPSPPAGYRSLSRERDVWARPGRDAAIVANSSAMMGGVQTATVMLSGDAGRSAEEWAALTIHELFHVFQRTKHPGWAANEVDLFTYPIEDTAALTLRHEESRHLRAAIAATSHPVLACEAERAVVSRQMRMSQIGAQAAAYERGTELNEGLAQYVELRALRRSVALPADDPPPAQVRERAYATGAAFGQLLDRLRPDWRAVLESAPSMPQPALDVLLGQTRSGPGAPRTSCARDDLVARWDDQIARDLRALRARRRQDRKGFLDQPGASLVVEAGAAPLFPQGFDPLNVRGLGSGEVLHTRFVKLGNDRGTVSTFDRAALTEGVGPHPLFNGVRRVTVTGLTTPVSVRDSAGILLVHATGVDVRLRGARADTSSTTIRISMP